MGEDTIRLTSTEITNLFIQYIQETMSICICKHVLLTVKDPEIHALFEFTLSLSEKHKERIKEFFALEKFPLPNGLTDKDVNLEAPPLFSDVFWLHYLHTMTNHGLTGYSLCFGTSSRRDIRDYYFQYNMDAMEVYNQSVDILLSKGLYEHPPNFSTPQKVEYITNIGYALDVIGKKRPLNSAEAGNIFFNLTKTRLAKGICLGFSQVAKNKEVRKHLEKGLITINKNYGTFSTLLREENLHIPSLLDTHITNSKVAPFSDKLIMINAGFLLGASTSYYGTALVSSLRMDVVGYCEEAILGVFKLLPNYGKIVIKNGWFEKLPVADDRRELPTD
ncbi:DUF3231 family protein [Margalitia sp. FSL K6-0131]|uniref:DUF3231 family protein n=1 Tax=Margalitia sp. FSL K6-0131 TaxID=2954604 RepID=UPI0030F94A1E